MNALARLESAVARASAENSPLRFSGRLTEVAPASCRVAGLSSFLRLGDRIAFGAEDGPLGEVIRIEDRAATVKCFDSRIELGLGAPALHLGPLMLRPDSTWRGRVVDALGRPVDGAGPLAQGERSVTIDAEPPPALRRARVTQPVKTGVRVMDCFTPLCAGQRIGIFAGSGVGKSTLLSMLARSRGFDTVVVGLVGERGREVREFLDEALGEARATAVVVVATGDESAMMRRLAPKTAMSVAEYFRDRGERVLLILDSVTRYAHASREVSLAAGEPAVSRGYTPSVFSELPKLLERAGPGLEGSGSITGLFAVLVDGDDHNDPIADAIRGTLDGHVVLDRAIADQGRYPAVNVLGSVSRLAQHVWTTEQRAAVLRLRAMIARFEDTRDLRLMGGYHAGQDLDLDQAVRIVPRIYEAMNQGPTSPPSEDAFRELAGGLQGIG